MFEAESVDVLNDFASLCRQYPNEPVENLWERAGGLTKREADGSQAALDEQVQAMIVESIWGGG